MPFAYLPFLLLRLRKRKIFMHKKNKKKKG